MNPLLSSRKALRPPFQIAQRALAPSPADGIVLWLETTEPTSAVSPVPAESAGKAGEAKLFASGIFVAPHGRRSCRSSGMPAAALGDASEPARASLRRASQP